MSDSDKKTAKAPWHLWVVGGLTLLWNAVGAMDFVLTETRNEAYLAEFPPEMMDYIAQFPTWAVVAWGVATLGSLVGSLLLLLRMKLASPVLTVAFVAMVITTIYNYVLNDGMEHFGGVGALIFSGVIFVVALLLMIYARRVSQAW